MSTTYQNQYQIDQILALPSVRQQDFCCEVLPNGKPCPRKASPFCSRLNEPVCEPCYNNESEKQTKSKATARAAALYAVKAEFELARHSKKLLKREAALVHYNDAEQQSLRKTRRVETPVAQLSLPEPLFHRTRTPALQAIIDRRPIVPNEQENARYVAVIIESADVEVVDGKHTHQKLHDIVFAMVRRDFTREDFTVFVEVAFELGYDVNKFTMDHARLIHAKIVALSDEYQRHVAEAALAARNQPAAPENQQGEVTRVA